MNVHYIYVYDIKTNNYNSSNGVERKINNQINGLQLSCVNTFKHFYGINTENPITYLRSCVNVFNNMMYIYKLSNNNGDIIYIRMCLPHLINYILLHLYPNSNVICEIQSLESDEFKSQVACDLYHSVKLYYMYFATLFFGRYIKRHSAGIVSVTNEISDYNKHITNYESKYLTLGNGIDVISFRLKKYARINNELHVLVVANVHIWHGIDRFIKGMSGYTGEKAILLHIVGNGAELPYLKSLTKQLHLESHVIFHGFKSGTDLDAMFDQCHIAVGSLGGFRINMHEMSSLKSGEYCARGIPFILAATAMDFPEDWPYIFHVPETETPINMDDVIGFADRVLANPNHVQEMREYAESHLDWMIKMKVLKEFLENL